MHCFCNVQLVYMDNFWKALVIFHEFNSLNVRKIVSGGLGWIYLIPKLMLSLIFGQSNYTDRKFRPLLPIPDFSS